jgi:glycosyltransferase involved in cell wall biosynthesis
MRILYICGDTGIEIGGRKGAATHVRETCHALICHGHDVLLIAASAGDRSQIRVPLREVRPPRAKWLGGDVRLMLLNRRMRKEIGRAMDEFKPDAVYERYSLYQTAGLELCARRRMPRILEVNTLLAREQSHRLHWPKWAERIEHYIWRRESAIIAVSHMLKRLMVESAGLNLDSMAAFVISPVAVDTELFHPGVTPVDMAQFGLGGRKIAGYMGTLTAWHGVELFFDAARLLRDGAHNVVVLAVGGEPERVERLRKRAKDEGVDSHLVFQGSVPFPDVPKFLAAMDVCLIPDTQDWSSPTKFFEFAAMQKPVVAAESPAVLEVLGPQRKCGRLFKRGDAGDMVAKVLEVLGDRQLAASMGRAARAARAAELHMGVQHPPDHASIPEAGREWRGCSGA